MKHLKLTIPGGLLVLLLMLCPAESLALMGADADMAAGIANEAAAAQETTMADERSSQPAAETASRYKRELWHWDSWASLIIILISIAVAVLLNHASPNLRAEGTLLASLGCFGLAAGVVGAGLAGVIGEPREPELPVDAFKPTVLVLQGLAALIAGGWLWRVFLWQRKRTDRLELPDRNSDDRYGRVSRYLHWSIAYLFVVLMVLGLFTSMIPSEAWYRHAYYVMHKSIGLTVLLLVLIRLGWNFASPRPKLAPSLKFWERYSAKTVHVLLYALLLGFPITGYLMSTFVGQLSYFFIWDLPLLWEADSASSLPPGFAHKVILPYLFYLLFGAHLLGALKHRYWDKHPDALTRIVG